MEHLFNLGDRVINIANETICTITFIRWIFGYPEYRLGMGTKWYKWGELKLYENRAKKEEIEQSHRLAQD